MQLFAGFMLFKKHIFSKEFNKQGKNGFVHLEWFTLENMRPANGGCWGRVRRHLFHLIFHLNLGKITELQCRRVYCARLPIYTCGVVVLRTGAF